MGNGSSGFRHDAVTPRRPSESHCYHRVVHPLTVDGILP